jgi:hypothetical protein
MAQTAGRAALHVVTHNDSPLNRLALARRHVENAISHINDVAQGRVQADTQANDDSHELRLIVRALADIREALRVFDQPTLAPPL